MKILNKKNGARIIFDIIFFIFLFLIPWYAAAFVIVCSIIFFNNFWEGAAAALAIDSLYYMPSTSPDLRFGVFFFSAVGLLFAIGFVKSKLRFGNMSI